MRSPEALLVRSPQTATSVSSHVPIGMVPVSRFKSRPRYEEDPWDTYILKGSLAFGTSLRCR